MTKRKDRQLSKASDCRIFMARIINATKHGEMTEGTLRSLSYSITVLLKCLEYGEMAQQLSRIEEKLGGKS